MAVDNPSYFSLSVSTSSTDTTTSPSSNCPSSSTNHTHRSGGHTGLTALFRRRPTCKMGATSSTSVASASTASTSTNHQESSSHRISGSSGSTPSTPTEERVPMLSRSTGNGTTTINQRRSFRNLFRSVSANDHERTQQFLKGDPRPSDVAPPSPYLPHRSHSHSENDRRRPARDRRVLKSASELLSNDMVYCGLSGDANDHDDDDDDDDDDQDSTEEVFLGVDDARYYNLSSTLPSPGSAASGQRRHSVGTFLGKDRNTCSGRRPTQTVEVLVEPSSMAPPIPTDTVDGIVRIDDRRDRSSECRSRRRRHRSSSSKGE
ncbi:phosphoinositide 3-kinase adapter protein 1-like isoform X1 [Vespula squamosa]|uniref:Phosphoinositide 3-kinase adapter protein 1-like isoform X1 n=1 Tax=Vespula squamosa TaxID=30214 RepID=A0ABD2C5M2_VESSQ